jgi:prepilin-type N-terminal cleavage/methylation domain-containing protein
MAVTKPRNGYTLLELILVCAIGVVLVAIAYPSLNGLAGHEGMTGKRGQKAATDQLKNKLAEARAQAMEEGRAYRFAIVVGKGNYRFAPDSDDFWGQGGSTSTAASGEKQLVVAGALPQGSMFCDCEDSSCACPKENEPTFDDPAKVSSGSYKALVTFLPDGTARDDGKIGVKTIGAHLAVLKLQALTGVVTTLED